MKQVFYMQIISLLFLVVFLPTLSSCVSSNTGAVTQVTMVPEGDSIVTTSTLNEEERQLLERAKKKGAFSPSPGASIDIATNKTIPVREYLDRYPEYGEQGQIDYTVGPSDILKVEVFDEQEMSRNAVRVSGDGYISFPLIGRIKVAGLTTGAIEQLIAQKLRDDGFFLNAQIAVLIAEYGSKRYKVLGAVKKPGIFFLKANEQILDALSEVGGIAPETAGRELLVIRHQPDQSSAAEDKKIVISINLISLLENGDTRSNLRLIQGDVIYVPKANLFYIMGEVKEPGSYTFTKKNITLVEAIGTAGGFTPIAARNKTRIIRVEDGREKIITVNVDAITDAGRKIHDVNIKPNDIIIVPQSFF
jgi:polysaccharide export outer membrane protein